MLKHVVGLWELLQPVGLDFEGYVGSIHVVLVLLVEPRGLLHGSDEHGIRHDVVRSVETLLVRCPRRAITSSRHLLIVYLGISLKILAQIILAWTGRGVLSKHVDIDGARLLHLCLNSPFSNAWWRSVLAVWDHRVIGGRRNLLGQSLDHRSVSIALPLLLNVLQVDDPLLRVVVQAGRSVRDLVDWQPRDVRRLGPDLVPHRVLARVVDVVIRLVALRSSRLILVESAVVERLAVRLHLPLSFDDFVAGDL